MGSTNNAFSLVDDGFKCIVLVDEARLKNAMFPFLNRFEKHIISFEYLLTKDFIRQADVIYKLIQDFRNPNLQENELDIKFNFKHLLINCEKEEIKGIIYSKICEYEKLGKKLLDQDLQDFVLEKIALNLPQDILFLLKHSQFNHIHPNVVDKVIDYYKKGEHTNLFNFLQKMENKKNVIYTFTDIEEPLLSHIKCDFDTKLLGKINRNVIKEIKISSINCESELEAILEVIYSEKENKTKIVIFKFNPYQTCIINYITFFLENYVKEKKEINCLDINDKIVYIFTIHINRIFLEDKKDPKKKKNYTR